MILEQGYNQHIWEILQEIKAAYLANNSSDHIKFNISREEQNLERRSSIVYELEKLGAIKIETVTGDRISVNDDLFEIIYEKYRELNEVSHHTNDHKFENKKGIKDIIKIRNITGMEKKFLSALSGMKPISFEDLRIKTGTKNLKSLKFSVQKKLNGTGWGIKSPQRGGWGEKSFYQLVQLTT